DDLVTGVQTCALPIYLEAGDVIPHRARLERAGGHIVPHAVPAAVERDVLHGIRRKNAWLAIERQRKLCLFLDNPRNVQKLLIKQIGRASCRERVDASE